MINLVDNNVDKNGLKVAWLISLKACLVQLQNISDLINRFKATEWVDSRLSFLNQTAEDVERLNADIRKLESEIENAHELFPETNGNKVLGFSELLRRNSLRNKTRQFEQAVFYLRFRVNQYLNADQA